MSSLGRAVPLISRLERAGGYYGAASAHLLRVAVSVLRLALHVSHRVARWRFDFNHSCAQVGKKRAAARSRDPVRIEQQRARTRRDAVRVVTRGSTADGWVPQCRGRQGEAAYQFATSTTSTPSSGPTFVAIDTERAQWMGGGDPTCTRCTASTRHQWAMRKTG